MSARYRIGIDVGGTFTDLFLLDQESGAVARYKLPSTPEDPHIAPIAGVREILKSAGASGAEVAFVGLGTTVATNALLERKGAVTGLITTAGFRDLLEIARQRRPHTFDLYLNKPETLVPRRFRMEVTGRMLADGSVLTPLDEDSLREAIDALVAAGAESIAICFLNSYANPEHEQEAAAIVRERWRKGHVSVSAEVLPEFREYERLSSTVVNAYLMPKTRDYLQQFEQSIGSLEITQTPFVINSGGGVITPEVAALRPIDTLLSGPSGGVSGAVYVSLAAGYRDIITFDMGGTSTDVCVVRDGRPQITHSRVINGIPLKAPAVDVHTVGAGGSSIALVDPGGMLRVGPHSAGSNPGPACYARGGVKPTVTDANVVLGRLNPEYLLGGMLKIDARSSHAAIEADVARKKRMSVTEAAASILAIADTNMAQALRFVSVERGLDPRDFVLVAFGGAGPLHAASVAHELGVAGVLVPYSPGVLCAMGVLTQDMRMDFSRTRIVLETSENCTRVIATLYSALENQAHEAFSRHRGAAQISTERSVDMRYRGQNHEITVPAVSGDIDDRAVATIKENFHRAHEELYGYRSPEYAVEFVTFRIKAFHSIPKHDLTRALPATRDSGLAPRSQRAVFFDSPGRFVDCPIYERGDLLPGDRLNGPAVIEQMDTTTVIPPDFSASIDASLNLFLTGLED